MKTRFSMLLLVIFIVLILSVILGTCRNALNVVLIQVNADDDCRGAELYVDGRFSLAVSDKWDVLYLKKGLRDIDIEARKTGYTSGHTSLRAFDWEQDPPPFIRLSCGKTNGVPSLRLDCIGRE